MQHQGGLAGTVGAEQRHPLAAPDGQVDTEQGLVAVRVGERQPGDLQRRRGTGPVGGGGGGFVHSGHVVAQPVTASARASTAGLSPNAHCRRVVRAVGQPGHLAAPAAGQHGQVHPLAALVGAHEQRSDAARGRAGLPEEARVVPAGDPGQPHPPGLPGDHVDVAQHQGGDRDHHGRCAQPLQAEQQVAQRGGGGQGERGEHPERALDQDVPRAQQPGLGQRQPEPGQVRLAAGERQQHGEHHERRLDQRPPGHPARPGSRPPPTPPSAAAGSRRRPRTPPAGWPPRRSRRGTRKRSSPRPGAGAPARSPGRYSGCACPAAHGLSCRIGRGRGGAAAGTAHRRSQRDQHRRRSRPGRPCRRRRGCCSRPAGCRRSRCRRVLGDAAAVELLCAVDLGDLAALAGDAVQAVRVRAGEVGQAAGDDQRDEAGNPGGGVGAAATLACRRMPDRPGNDATSTALRAARGESCAVHH